MACNLTLNGLAVDCAGSIGGVAKVYIANYEDVTEITSNDTITAISMAEGKKFKAFNFRKNMASFTSTLTVDAGTGNNYVTTDLAMTFNKMETVKRVEMSALSVNELAVIVKDNNGIYWYLGKDNAVTASAGTGETGVARTDASKYTITLQDFSATYPLEVDKTIVDALVEEVV